jgi:hypothetical protein
MPVDKRLLRQEVLFERGRQKEKKIPKKGLLLTHSSMKDQADQLHDHTSIACKVRLQHNLSRKRSDARRGEAMRAAGGAVALPQAPQCSHPIKQTDAHLLLFEHNCHEDNHCHLFTARRATLRRCSADLRIGGLVPQGHFRNRPIRRGPRPQRRSPCRHPDQQRGAILRS